MVYGEKCKCTHAKSHHKVKDGTNCMMPECVCKVFIPKDKPRHVMGSDLSRDPDGTIVVIKCTSCGWSSYPEKIVDQDGALELHVTPCSCYGHPRDDEDEDPPLNPVSISFRVPFGDAISSEAYKIMHDHIRKKALEAAREEERKLKDGNS